MNPISEAEIIERRSNPHSKRFIILLLATTALVSVVYYTQLLLSLRVPLAYLIPIILIYSIILATNLYHQGTGTVSGVPLTAGIILITGGAIFDMMATVIKSPSLVQEANPIVRSFLDSGYSVEFVYAYGLIAQVLLMTLGCVLWAAFLKHRETIIALARISNPTSYLSFIKAATGGAHLSWRQYLLPLKLSELPKAYHFLWVIIVMWVVTDLVRWYFGLEWLKLAPVSRNTVLIVLSLLSLIVYSAWLWVRYSKQSKGNH